MSVSAAEAPAFAFAFQARRFACDRCHRYKLKCERGPLIMTSGVPTPLGPCKRCEKARMGCTSSNTAITSSSKQKDVRANHTPTNQTKTTAAATATAPRQASPNTAGTPSVATQELAPFSSSAGPPFTTPEPTLVDPSLFLDTFDFDLGAISGDRSDHFNVPSVFPRGLLSPNRSSDGNLNTPTTEPRATEQHSPFHDIADLNANGLAMSDLLNASPTESPGWSGHQPPSSAPDAVDSSSHPSSLKETLEKLGELQSFIFREFGSISEASLATTFLSQSTVPCNGTANASLNGNLVGKVLCASEGLIDILTSCGRYEANEPSVLSPSPSRPRGTTLMSGSKRSHGQLLDDAHDVHPKGLSNSTSRIPSSSADPRVNQLDLLRKNHTIGVRPSPLPTPPRWTPSGESETPIYSGLLSPAKLTLLVCYVTLLGVYRSILLQAFDMLRTPLSSSQHLRISRARPYQSSNASPPSSPAMNSSTILGFRIQLEMLTHT